MFVTAFSLGPPLFYMTTSMRIKIDGWKYCSSFRRVDPRIAEDIGVWRAVMSLISVCSVVYVFGMIFFSLQYLPQVKLDQKWLCFLAVEHVMFVVKYLMQSKRVADVVMQLRR
jgi:hypothetical protein